MNFIFPWKWSNKHSAGFLGCVASFCPCRFIKKLIFWKSKFVFVLKVFVVSPLYGTSTAYTVIVARAPVYGTSTAYTWWSHYSVISNRGSLLTWWRPRHVPLAPRSGARHFQSGLVGYSYSHFLMEAIVCPNDQSFRGFFDFGTNFHRTSDFQIVLIKNGCKMIGRCMRSHLEDWFRSDLECSFIFWSFLQKGAYIEF